MKGSAMISKKENSKEVSEALSSSKSQGCSIHSSSLHFVQFCFDKTYKSKNSTRKHLISFVYQQSRYNGGSLRPWPSSEVPVVATFDDDGAT